MDDPALQWPAPPGHRRDEAPHAPPCADGDENLGCEAALPFLSGLGADAEADPTAGP